jgi:hypothetical protein
VNIILEVIMQTLLLERLSPKVFRLCEDFKSECGITVPIGFISDGISAPAPVRWFITPTGHGFNAALVHDYLLQEGYSWEHANERFKEQLILDDVPKWRIILYYSGVSVWGFFKRKY